MHSIDVSLIIAPVIHEYLKGYADALEVDYDEGFGSSKEEEDQIEYGRNLMLARKMLADARKAERDFPYDPEAGLTKQEGMNFFGPDGRIRDNYVPKPEPKGKVVDTDSPDYERMLKDDPIREASVRKPKGLMART
jgi:hypothetical protein